MDPHRQELVEVVVHNRDWWRSLSDEAVASYSNPISHSEVAVSGPSQQDSESMDPEAESSSLVPLLAVVKLELAQLEQLAQQVAFAQVAAGRQAAAQRQPRIAEAQPLQKPSLPVAWSVS